MNLKIKNALISVSDKENIVPLLRVLKKYSTDFHCHMDIELAIR